MKYLLVPMLIMGMFVSFAAAMLAMLFFTETVNTKEELERIITGGGDPTWISDDFIDPEDNLGKLFNLVNEYQSQFETAQRKNEELRDSLHAAQAMILSREAAVASQEAILRQEEDSTRSASRQANLAQMIPIFNKLKPGPASDILQEGSLGDTTVALLMKDLQPQQTAKIMASMDAAFAAKITKIIQEL